MKTKHILSAIAFGLGLAAVLLLSLAHPTFITRADPGIYYVREGATGDCLSAATPCGSVQQAVDLIDPTGSSDEVWIAAGTYNENLTIEKSVKLRGGWDTGFTTQNPASTPAILDGGAEHNVRVENAPQAEVILEGLTLRNGRDGVHVWTGNLTVERCTILNMEKQGLEIEGGDILISATQILSTQQGIEIDSGVVQVMDVRIAHTLEEGVLIEGGGTVSLTASTIEDCQQQGLQIDQGELWLFDNLIRDTQGDGIRVEGGAVAIISNTVHTTLADGVDVSGTQVISGNLVYDTAARGIYAHDGTLTVLNNRVSDVGSDGIRTADGAVVTIRGNTVINAGNDGIDARGMSVTVSDNHISGAKDRGINAEEGALTIADNTVHDTAGDGIRTAGSGTLVDIRANAVYGVGNDGIDARGDVITISHNTVNLCADNGIRSEGDERAQVEANLVLSNGLGIAIRGAPSFWVTNNVVAEHITASTELTGTGTGYLYHNTLVGSSTGVQGIGVSVLDPLVVSLANNIIVNHDVGISAVPGATLIATDTLMWGNNDNQIDGGTALIAPPLFVAPAQYDYHLLVGSPAIEAGTDVGVTSDMDGESRPIGTFPDIGADEYPVGLRPAKQVRPQVVEPGSQLVYTVSVTNNGSLTLTTDIVDTLPDHVTPGGTRAWEATIAPGDTWMDLVTVTVAPDDVGPLVNVVRATAAEGVWGVYTHTLAPDLEVTKEARPDPVRSGERLRYTIQVRNSGNFHLHATITDTLPLSVSVSEASVGTVYLPGGATGLVWTAVITAPDGVWTQGVVVTVAEDYTGPLTNAVQVTTDEGAAGEYTTISTAGAYNFIYLPVVLRNY